MSVPLKNHEKCEVDGLRTTCSYLVQFQVNSYNPYTSFGEHQFFIYINAQDAEIVHVPIVPTRLGDIHVTIHASTLIGKDTITRKLHVEVSGVMPPARIVHACVMCYMSVITVCYSLV
jgi:hypothetical protein